MEQKRIIKLKVWDKKNKEMVSVKTIDFNEDGFIEEVNTSTYCWSDRFENSNLSNIVIMRSTGILDKNKVEIFEGDILEFADKWEWYRGSYGIKMLAANEERRKELQRQYDLEPMERREVSIPESYEWLLNSEIQTYWQVIGSIYSTPNLL